MNSILNSSTVHSTMATSHRRARKRGFISRKPITSYGIILVHYDTDTNSYKTLLYRRRDSFEYIDFIRGMWSTEDHAIHLLTSMNREERTRILKHTFDELWNDLWVDHRCRLFTEGYHRAKKRFESIANVFPTISLDSVGNKRPLWGFPKGKKNYSFENSITCALREFEEETTISRDKLVIQSDKPFVEIFTGTNGRRYMTQYFLATIDQMVQPAFRELPDRLRVFTISEEASDVKWCTQEEAEVRLCPNRFKLLVNAIDEFDEYVTGQLRMEEPL